MRRKIELFFRGEFWLHLSTIFFFLSLIIFIFPKTPNWLLITITVILAIGKELYDKYHDKKYISYSDIIGTLIGGILSMIFYSKIF